MAVAKRSGVLPCMVLPDKAKAKNENVMQRKRIALRRKRKAQLWSSKEKHRKSGVT